MAENVVCSRSCAWPGRQYRALSKGTLIKANLVSSDEDEDDYSSSNSARRPRARGCEDSPEYDY